jgi:hypothetical protein
MISWRQYLVRREPSADGNGTLRPRWNRIIGLLALLIALGWIGLGTALFGYLRWHKQVANLNWFDAAWPGRWPVLSMKLGEHYLRIAASSLEKREFDRALHYYRAGLARAPLNPEPRLQLAQLYLLHRRPDLAQKLLLDRLDALASDETYLRRALQFLIEFQYDRELATYCEQHLANPRAPHRQLVSFYAATLAFYRGDFDHAESLLLAGKMDRTPEGALLMARLDAARDYAQLALLRLGQMVNEDTATNEAYAEIARIQRQLGETHKLEATATLHLANDPLSPAPRLTLLHLHHERGDQAALAREISDYLTFYGDNAAALFGLADFAAHTGRPALARRIEDIARARGWSLQAAALMTAEAHIAAGEFSAGLEIVRGLIKENPGWVEQLGPVFDSLQAIALFSLNRSDEARLHLEHLLSRSNLRTENLQAVASRLIALGHQTHARSVLERVVNLDPRNQAALTLLVRIQAENGRFDNFAPHVRRLLQMRKPSRDTLELAHRRFGRDLNLLHPEHSALLAEIGAHLHPPGALRL